jgi:hypothetical protein
MPHFILKPEPDKDLYVWWSTITEVPMAVGTRAELAVQMSRSGEDSSPERFDRADQRGTSSVDGLDGWADGATTGSVIVEQRGFVQLKDLPEVFRCMEAGESYDHVVIPFDDDTEDVHDPEAADPHRTGES